MRLHLVLTETRPGFPIMRRCIVRTGMVCDGHDLAFTGIDVEIFGHGITTLTTASIEIMFSKS